MTASTTPPINIHGRKPGRGIRPWLLIPKVIAVAIFFGGLVAALVVATAAGPDPQGHALRQTAEMVARIIRWMVIPGGAAAAVLGILLTLQHPSILLRQRWLQVKLLLLALGPPAMHFLVRAMIERIRQSEIAALARPIAAPALSPSQALAWAQTGLGLAIVLTLLVMILGRQKPRLGQNWARAYPRPRK
ncbi:MAG: hypothetical protein IT443_11605 [Phycisphaeraceae bacterium]|nr:hypothetical protein [Phycisphaeraceae bacterium]